VPAAGGQSTENASGRAARLIEVERVRLDTRQRMQGPFTVDRSPSPERKTSAPLQNF